MKKESRIIIIGGGLSGCTIGYLLIQNGYLNVSIIEKDDDIGGLCRTYKIGGNKYEFGPHIFHSDKPEVIKIIKKLMSYHEVKPIVRSCPFNNINDLYDYPLTISNIFKLKNKEDIVYELYNINPKELDNTNFETYVTSMIGKRLYNIFIKNYNKKQWGIEPKEMSANWAPKRISLRKNNKLLFHNMWSIYPKDGYDHFFRNLTREIKIIQGKFKELIYNDNIIKAVRLKDDRVFDGDIFISSIPIDYLFKNTKKLTYRGVFKSFILLKRKKLLNGLWYTFPNHYNFTRIMEYKGYTLENNNNNNNNNTIISAVFPFNTDEINSIPESDWNEEFRNSLKKLFKVKDSEIIKQFSMKRIYAYPILTEENESIYIELLRKLVSFENIFSLGRLGLFIYVPMHVCMKQAIRMMDLIKEYKFLTNEERIQKYIELR